MYTYIPIIFSVSIEIETMWQFDGLDEKIKYCQYYTGIEECTCDFSDSPRKPPHIEFTTLRFLFSMFRMNIYNIVQMQYCVILWAILHILSNYFLLLFTVKRAISYACSSS